MRCANCGNTRSWNNVVTDGDGITADCVRCGQTYAGDDVKSGGSRFSFGSITTNGPAVFGNGNTVTYGR